MIKAIITDFDGTLVDTFDANLRAYQVAFAKVGITLSEGQYRDCYGLRFDDFMQTMGVCDDATRLKIKDIKMKVYPQYFYCMKPNLKLIELITRFHNNGGKTAIASTARKENLLNVLNFLGVGCHFDLIYAGVDVKQGKPSPEIYLKTMAELGVNADEVMIYEDSEVGMQAAISSGAMYTQITNEWFLS